MNHRRSPCTRNSGRRNLLYGLRVVSHWLVGTAYVFLWGAVLYDLWGCAILPYVRQHKFLNFLSSLGFPRCRRSSRSGRRQNLDNLWQLPTRTSSMEMAEISLAVGGGRDATIAPTFTQHFLNSVIAGGDLQVIRPHNGDLIRLTAVQKLESTDAEASFHRSSFHWCQELEEYFPGWAYSASGTDASRLINLRWLCRTREGASVLVSSETRV